MAPAGLAAAERLETITKLAGVLSAPESEVEQLLTDGRLTGSLLLALQGRGVSITPSVKNSVQAMVHRRVRTQRARRAPRDLRGALGRRVAAAGLTPFNQLRRSKSSENQRG